MNNVTNIQRNGQHKIVPRLTVLGFRGYRILLNNDDQQHLWRKLPFKVCAFFPVSCIWSGIKLAGLTISKDPGLQTTNWLANQFTCLSMFIYWREPIGSVFKTVLLKTFPANPHVLPQSAEHGMASFCLFGLGYHGLEGFLLSECVKLMRKRHKAWWRCLLSFLSYPKILAVLGLSPPGVD